MLKLVSWRRSRLVGTDCRFWFEFWKPVFRFYVFPSFYYLEVGGGATVSPWFWQLFDSDSSFENPFFGFFRFFFVFYLEFSVVTTITLSFDWLSILIRVSKVRFGCFFVVFLGVSVGETISLSSTSNAFRFWSEFRRSVFRFFSPIFFLPLLA